MTRTTRVLLCLSLLVASVSRSFGGDFTDPSRSFGVPTLQQTPQGQVALSWTEKDQAGLIHFYWALSADKGKTFGPKQLIAASASIGSSRLMRPKLLFKKDGSMVAVFSMRPEENAPQADAHAGHDAHAGNHAPTPAKSSGGGRPRDSQIAFCLSKDGGKTWTKPAPVHSDKTPNVVRGFFDAIVMANGEVAVAYLNDIEGKAHSRDLRFVTSKGDSFGKERILDPFVCDCCNISLLVDKNGALHMYYRENKENIRDIATMVSADNGQTFSQPRILFPDNWKINGCPHSGPTSATGAGSPLIAWFSGVENARGIRLVTDEGKRQFIIDNLTAKNPYLVSAPQAPVLLWEQVTTSESNAVSTIAYRMLTNGNTETKFLNRPAANASGLVIGNQLLVAYEGLKPNANSTLEWVSVPL